MLELEPAVGKGARLQEQFVDQLPLTVRTDNAPKVHFSATLGEEPEVEPALIQLLRARSFRAGRTAKRKVKDWRSG